MFKKLDDDQAILIQGGVYKQVDLYEWNTRLYARLSGGFVRLNLNGSTSKPQVRLEHLVYEGQLFSDQFGRLCTSDGEKRKPVILENSSIMKLLE